jgi:hypothetical protein
LPAIALAGIIMRNSVILVDQIQQDLRRRLSPAEAILALVPLAISAFWGPMAIAIMGELVSATLLTLFFVPALYAAWTRVPRALAGAAGRGAPGEPPASALRCRSAPLLKEPNSREAIPGRVETDLALDLDGPELERRLRASPSTEQRAATFYVT